MLVIPAIDVLDGKVVRLRKGLRDTATFYGDLEQILKGYQKAGVKRIHLVDLNAAFGEESSLIERLRPFSDMKFQVGGGFRSREKIRLALENTNYDIVVGSLLTSGDPEVLDGLDTKRIIAALDVVQVQDTFIIQDNGWRQDTKKNILEVIESLKKFKFQAFLVTDISRDGELTGPNFDLYQNLRKNFPELQFIASGGVQREDDFSVLSDLCMDSVVVGKALFENRITLAEVLSWQQ